MLNSEKALLTVTRYGRLIDDDREQIGFSLGGVDTAVVEAPPVEKPV